MLDGLDGARQRYWIIGLTLVDPVGSNRPKRASGYTVVARQESHVQAFRGRGDLRIIRAPEGNASPRVDQVFKHGTSRLDLLATTTQDRHMYNIEKNIRC